MDATDRLFETEPFDFSPENRALFVASFRESALCHYRGNAVFRAFWDAAGQHPEQIETEDDVLASPPLMVHLFKERELRSVPLEEVALTLTSSGTGGQKSRIFLSARSLARVKRLAWQIHRALGLVSDEEVDYVCFTYDPHVAKDLGTAFTDEMVTSFTRRGGVTYALRFDEARHEFVFDERGVLAALERSAAARHPVRLLGFPAYLYRLLREHDVRLDLGPRSFVQTGGGWKGFSNEEIPKEQFRALVAERLGIPVANVRDMFGMVEHGIPYVDCAQGQLHIPNYARVVTRAPGDLRLLPAGETGLLQFFCTYLDSYPSINLLTTDWGRVGRCECGLPGATLEIRGRAGVTKHKGCAITALEIARS
jgi:phenylacetate-coenzyme A ligase PaaK-like adenylate-forming protein